MLKLNIFRHKNRSIFISWLSSYLALLLIPLITTSVVYYKTGSVIENEINRANKAILRQVVQVIDRSMKDIDRIAMELSVNSKIRSLLYVRKPLKNTDRYNITDIVNREIKINAATGFLKDCYIFFKNGDFVLKPKAYYEPQMAYQDFHKNSSLSYDDWQELVHKNYYKDCIPVGVENEYSSTEDTLAYILSFPSENDPAANLILLLNKSYINETIKNIEWISEGKFYIMDNKNQILISNSDNSFIRDFTYDSLKEDSNIFYSSNQGENVVVSYMTSNIMNWKYISVFPSQIFMEKAAYARKVAALGLSIFMILGAAVAYIFTRKNYNPMQKLIGLLKANLTAQSPTFTNEYEFIKEAVNRTLFEKEEIGRKLNLQNKELRTNFLVRLLRGRISSKNLMNMFLTYNIDFSFGRFAVIIFHITDCLEFFKDDFSEPQDDNLTLIEFAVTNVIGELAGENHPCEIVELNGKIACIINAKSSEKEKIRSDLFNIANKVKIFARNNLYSGLAISVSAVHETPEAIPAAYQEALEAIEYSLIIGGDEVIFYDEITNSSQEYHYPIETEIQLINNIKAGNYKSSKDILDNIFNSNFQNNSLSFDMIRCLMFDLTSTIVKALNEFSGSFNQDLWNIMNPIERLLNVKTVKEMKASMEDILKTVCLHIDKKKESHNVNLKENIITYIQDNYKDFNLGNASIAEYFNMNASYLSRFFKGQTGEGVSDFINKVRLKEAKRLLKENESNITEIANKVGYYNNVALIRAFKKYEGITPGKYKKIP